MELTEILISYKNKNQDAVKVSSSVEVYNFILNHWDDDTLDIQENVKMLLLNSSNTILGVYDVSRGSINSTVIDLRLVLSVALKCLASSIILVHNHPSGNINPSEQDREFTKKIKSACKFLEIQLFDHIIDHQA